MSRQLAYFLFSLFVFPLSAQLPATSVPDAAEASKIDALESLIASLKNDELDLEKLSSEIKNTTLEEKKKELTAEIAKISEKIKSKKQKLATTATGIDISVLGQQASKPFSVAEEMQNIFSPLMRELREATAQPREIENLSIEITRWEKQYATTEEAIRNLDMTLGEKLSPELKTRLTALRKTWVKQQEEARSQVKSYNIQLAERKKNAPPVIAVVTKGLSYFWKNRGLSLLLSLLAGLITFTIIRRFYRYICRFSPLHKNGDANIGSRLLDVIANGSALVFAVIAALLVLYSRNDWLLLTAAFIFLLGLAWVSRTALPPYFEQIRLILNLGTVHIGERIIFNNLPYQVKTLNFISILENPDLSGGKIQVPAKVLLNYHSRPNMPDEPWFPTRIDDWVRLDDGIFGKVVHQTPEQIVILKLSGSYVTLTVEKYLAKSPENLSKGFGVSTTFGLDYRYQSIATTTIPQIIEAKVRERLLEKFPAEAILNVKVEFSSASASSLDFIIMMSADGSLAPQSLAISRILQQCAVDAANENQWVIPFPQLTIHQN